MDQVKKIFKRVCMNHGSLTLDKVDEILKSLCEACEVNKPEDIKEFVKNINKDLNQCNQKLEFYKHPLADNTEFLVFASICESEVSKQQMHYTETDRYYFLKLMESLVMNENYGISWANVYNIKESLANAEKALTKQRMQELVEKWTMQGYYLQKGDKLYIGPRLVVEFGTHLKMNYSESVDECPLCNKLALWDIQCSECKVRIHRDCIRTYLAKKSNCPSCKNVWNTRLS